MLHLICCPCLMFVYFKLIDSAIKERPSHNRVNRGLITLLFKTREKEHIGNWHPIILLNVSYKMFTKVLQLRLQPIFMEIIDVDQNIQLDLFYTMCF
jgi:hypothetical protein